MPDDSNKKYDVYYSKAAAKQLDLKRIHPDFDQYLARAAGMDIVFMVPGVDIHADPMANIGSSPDQPESMKKALQAVPNLPWRKYLVDSQDNTESLQEVFKLMATRNGNAFGKALETNSLAVVGYSIGNDVKSILNQIVPLPAGSLKNIPADLTADSLKAAILLHEVHHVGQTKAWQSRRMNTDHHMEADADVKAYNDYFKLIEAGAKISPAVPEFLQGLRAIATIKKAFGADDYFGSYQQYGGETGFSMNETLENMQSMRAFEPISHATNIAMNIRNGKVELTGIEAYKTAPGITKLVTMSLAMTSVVQGMDIKVKGDEKEEGESWTGVQEFNKAHPAIEYASIKALLEKGMLDDNPAAKEVANDYLDACDKYLPAYKSSPDARAFLKKAGDAEITTRMNGLMSVLQSRIDRETANLEKIYNTGEPDPVPLPSAPQAEKMKF